MKMKTKGFGLGGKYRAVSESATSLHKKESTTVTSNWGTKKATTKETAERSPVKHRPSYEVREIEIADIKITESAPGVKRLKNR